MARAECFIESLWRMVIDWPRVVRKAVKKIGIRQVEAIRYGHSILFLISQSGFDVLFLSGESRNFLFCGFVFFGESHIRIS